MDARTIRFIGEYSMGRQQWWTGHGVKFTPRGWDNLCEWIATGTIIAEATLAP